MDPYTKLTSRGIHIFLTNKTGDQIFNLCNSFMVSVRQLNTALSVQRAALSFFLHTDRIIHYNELDWELIWPRCYQRWSLPSTPTNSQGHSQVSPWLQDIPHPQPAWCTVRNKMQLVSFLYFPPFLFSFWRLQEEQRNLPGCYSCPGIPEELFPISLCFMRWRKAMRSFIHPYFSLSK